jgi:pimeloyl-ACP methyl ester carboxylesterase
VTRLRGWGLVGLGSLLLAAGVGIGIRPVASGAWGWRGVLGAAFAVIGLGLAFVGARSVTSGLRPLPAVASWMGLSLLVLAVTSTLTPAVVATTVPPIPRESSPQDFGLDAIEVTYPGDSGGVLAAWYLAPRDGAVVIIRHGSGSNAGSVLSHAALLAEHGYGLLLTDASGHGASSGNAMDFGWFGESDIANSVDFLLTQPEVDAERIAVLGLSMGAEEALGAIGADTRIAAVVAEGATARIADDKQWLSEVYGWRGAVQEWLETAQYAVTDLLTPASPPSPLVESVSAAAPRPVLLVVAGEVPDEGHAAEHIAGSSDNARIWVAPGAGHIGALTADPEGYERQVVGFLDRVLDPPTNG